MRQSGVAGALPPAQQQPETLRAFPRECFRIRQMLKYMFSYRNSSRKSQAGLEPKAEEMMLLQTLLEESLFGQNFSCSFSALGKPGCCLQPGDDFISLDTSAQALCASEPIVCAGVGKCVSSQLPFFFHCRIINQYFSWRAVNSHYTGLSQSCFFLTEEKGNIQETLHAQAEPLLHTLARFGL